MRRVSAGERLIVAAAAMAEARRKSVVRTALFRDPRRVPPLDDRILFISVAVPEAPSREIPTAPGSNLLMNRLIICFASVLVASIGLAQDKQELKDQKDKASYSIGL